MKYKPFLDGAMIPRLETAPRALSPNAAFMCHLAGAGFEGDIGMSATDQTIFSTDNSLYQVKPEGILFPRNTGDVRRIAVVLSRPEFADVTLAPRGGGTGTKGQSLTKGIVVDRSRHINRPLEIDPVRRIARVEAGAIKDQLDKVLAPHGLFFAPELSTSNRVTIGDMISTDACGRGSCLYRKTSSHVLAICVALTGGTDFLSRRWMGRNCATAWAAFIARLPASILRTVPISSGYIPEAQPLHDEL